MKRFIKKLANIPILFCIISSFVINFIIEAFSRHSIIEAGKYFISTPLVFFYNSMIILLTLSVIYLFKRRASLFLIISAVWIGFGITNGIILSNRVTPFTAIDFALIKSGLSVMTNYFRPWQLILIGGGLVVAVVMLIIGLIVLPKCDKKINYRNTLLGIIIYACVFLLTTKAVIKTEVIATYFGNIAFAYLDYGFPYCFSNTIFNTGIHKPSNYCEETVEKILASDPKETGSSNVLLANGDTSNSTSSTSNSIDASDVSETSTPNIIMIQLESFFDPSKVKGLELSEDPIPTFRKLSEEYTSGYLSVPAVGAGTANTEFEILSGMSLDFFGPGEYPYKTILKKTTCESINYNLKDYGYETHAIHNNKGTFYSRHKVFSMLGFDTFTSLEYMDDAVDTTPLGWTDDKYLTNEIMDSLNSTNGQDFIYTITVQSHGSYPDYEVLENPEITVSGLDDEGLTNSYEYYVNELHDVDNFISDLIDTLSNFDEDTILVMYGDHLPTLGLTNETLENGDIYQTPYVIWDNFGLQKEDKDLEAFQLTSDILNKIGIHNGTLIKYHQDYQETDDYLENLEILQYDMLYGERYVYGGINPYDQTDLQMGVKDISISDVYVDEDNNLYVTGKNFTPCSKVAINGDRLDTEYIDGNTLKITDQSIDDDDVITVQQVTSSNHALSESESFTYKTLEGESSEEIILEKTKQK